MNATANYNRSNLDQPTVFRPEFNNANINANQAWSLFFTAGKSAAELGNENELGRFFTNLVIAIVAATVIGSFLY